MPTVRPKMEKVARFALVFLLFAAPAAAQGPGRFSLFGGFSYTNYGPVFPNPPAPIPPGPRHSLEGWNFSLEGKIVPFLGVVADFSGHYGNETTGVSCLFTIRSSCGFDNQEIHLYAFQLGPQLSLSLGRFAPFAHALAGGAHVFRPVSCGCVLPNGQPPPNFAGDSFAYTVGGGLDYRISTRRFYIRAQADALHTRFSYPIGIGGARTGKTSLRLSAGLVFHF
jgi:hypothetical protein